MKFIFNRHPEIADDAHAFMSPSQSAWLNYDMTKLIETYDNHRAIEHGTKLHALAKDLILEVIKLPRSNKTLNAYVNDAIGFGLTPEVPLVYSFNCFGHADAISFDKRNKFLRIHDLKTGLTKAHMRQLKIYAALFCLEYKYDPLELGYELRIYQYDEIEIDNPDPKEIRAIANTIVEMSNEIDEHTKELIF